jgi:hypothetical protein
LADLKDWTTWSQNAIKNFEKHRKMRPSRPIFCWAIFGGFFGGFLVDLLEFLKDKLP